MQVCSLPARPARCVGALQTWLGQEGMALGCNIRNAAGEDKVAFNFDRLCVQFQGDTVAAAKPAAATPLWRKFGQQVGELEVVSEHGSWAWLMGMVWLMGVAACSLDTYQ